MTTREYVKLWANVVIGRIQPYNPFWDLKAHKMYMLPYFPEAESFLTEYDELLVDNQELDEGDTRSALDLCVNAEYMRILKAYREVSESRRWTCELMTVYNPRFGVLYKDK